MSRLSRYACSSFLAVAGVFWHAWWTKEQFYPAVVHLSTSKISRAIVGNFALSLGFCLGKAIQLVFFGTLRDVEIEKIVERGKEALMETCLALTIFRSDFDANTVVLFAALFFAKVFHWLAQDREEYLETSPEIRIGTHAKLVSFLAILLVVDVVFLQHALLATWKTGPSVLLLFAFEYTILCSTVIMTASKYGLFMADAYMEGSWTGKGTVLFYLELAMDFFHMLVYVSFFSVVLANYGLPLHLMRDLYWTFRNFRNRLVLFLRYRKIAANMNTLFPDATQEELDRADRTCIVCREDMQEAKKLPCQHCFHVQCLRSWLERQQSCPICRSAVPTEPPSTRESMPQAGVQRVGVRGFQENQEHIHPPPDASVGVHLRHRHPRTVEEEEAMHPVGQHGAGDAAHTRRTRPSSVAPSSARHVEEEDWRDLERSMRGLRGWEWGTVPSGAGTSNTGVAGLQRDRHEGLSLPHGKLPTQREHYIAMAAAAAATQAASQHFDPTSTAFGSFYFRDQSEESKALTREVILAQRAYLSKKLELLDVLERELKVKPKDRDSPTEGS